MVGMTKRMRTKRGFTMVELLVVIIIISVLVAIALPRYFAAIYAGRVRACQSNFKIVNTAVQAYFAQNKVWPSEGELGIFEMLPPDNDDAATPGGLAGGQLTEMPICPFATDADPIPYTLIAVYEDPAVPSTPQVGVVMDWTGHWPTAQWQNSTEHGAAAIP
jgi:prepilin-type N-terminal cleavage/methylation domain-containing protein